MLLHWEGDENGGMDRFMAQASESQLVGSALSIMLNASGFGLHARTQGFMDGQMLGLGAHRLRFLETPHVHHWDSMMLFDETTKSVFPSDLFIQPGDQPPVVSENLGSMMCEYYRQIGIFAHEQPVRDAVDRIEGLDPNWIHGMHGGSLGRETIPYFTRARREEPVFVKDRENGASCRRQAQCSIWRTRPYRVNLF